MQRVIQPPIYKPSKCKNCNKEYQAKFVVTTSGLKDSSMEICPECFKKQKEEWDKQEREEEEKIKTAQVASQRRLWREKIIPQRYLLATFETFKTTRGNLSKVKNDCVKYANNFPFERNKPYKSLMLHSSVGCGKTHLVCSIAHRILDRWVGQTGMCPVYFVTEPDIYQKIIATYSYTMEERQMKDSEDDIINHIINYPLLIIDDLAKDEKNDMRFVRRTMFKIIDGRYKANRPVVITTNKNFDQLAFYLNENGESPCADRLFEMTKDNAWQIDAESYRLNPIK